jgi:integrative and conjugative element protein (TIGR02256 family)
MPELEFWSTDDLFGLRVTQIEVKKVRQLCERSLPNETGGILLGHYSVAHDCALVTTVTGAPTDSHSGRTWFIRGVRGLQRTIDRLWNGQHRYYLGEWHFHPMEAPKLSPRDIQQMQEISQSEQYHCPEPVLLIIGGDPKGQWSAGAYIFPRNRPYVELLAINFTAGEDGRDHQWG